MAKGPWVFERPREGIGVRIDFQFDVRSLALLSPAQTAALMQGIAKVLAAGKKEEAPDAR